MLLLPGVPVGSEEAFARLAVRFTDEQWSLMGDVMREVEDEMLDVAEAQSTIRAEDSGYFDGSDGNGADSDEENNHDSGAYFDAYLGIVE